ncbi:Hypothetical predicted protein, partial [Pelobates cultripes]
IQCISFHHVRLWTISRRATMNEPAWNRPPWAIYRAADVTETGPADVLDDVFGWRDWGLR